MDVRVEGEKYHDFLMTAGPIRGKRPGRVISAFKSRDITYGLPESTVRLGNVESAGSRAGVVDLEDWSMKTR